jgi:hypothetical protein
MKMNMLQSVTGNKVVRASVEITINGEKLNVNMKPAELPEGIRALLLSEGLLFTDKNRGVTFWTPMAIETHIEGL